MKFLSLLTTLALTSLALAAAVPPQVEDLTLFERQEESDLAKRAPEPAPISHEEEAGALEERARGGGGRIKPGRAPSGFSPDGSGFGYGQDSQGHGPPSQYPRDWEYYGRSIGWAPYRGWQPPPRWEPPTAFIRVWDRVTWWSPPTYWRSYWFSRYHNDWYRYGVPSFWHWRPHNPSGRGHWVSRNGGDFWESGGRNKRDIVELEA